MEHQSAKDKDYRYEYWQRAYMNTMNYQPKTEYQIMYVDEVQPDIILRKNSDGVYEMPRQLCK